MNKINVPVKENKLLEKTLKLINENEEVAALWKVINVNAMERLGWSDHGPVHFQIVANGALKICRLIVESGVEMSVVSDFDLTPDHAELIIVLASLFHDLGMSVNRQGHEEYSLFLANRLLHQILEFLPVEERVVVVSEVLHAIISHREDGRPMTLEAGILRVADALDMSEGRSRIPYEKGEINIHAISASAINKVTIKKGKDKPVQLEIEMNNSSGVFQIDELLKSKIKHSGIEKYVSVKASTIDKEKRLISEFRIDL